MLEILSGMVEELMNEDLTLDELKSLAKDISDHNELFQALQNNPNIDLECIEVVGDRAEYRY
ncbi:hypothetical protein [Arenicella sp. 4NH20-0111]|uniref:hypothetical protein n=1 Tax=Arenicella sp. 4NH20-0111 TaxID=3127648 RepID=UPI003342DE33